MPNYCNLPQEAYWDAAGVMLFFHLGDGRLPDDVYAPCSECEHVGWRWRIGAVALCRACRAYRLRAARLLSAISEKQLQEQGDETPSKATGEARQGDTSPATR